MEALKVAMRKPAGETMSGRLLLYDAQSCAFRNVRLRARRPDCAVCADRPAITRLAAVPGAAGPQACPAAPAPLPAGHAASVEELAAARRGDSNGSNNSAVVIDVRDELQYVPPLPARPSFPQPPAPARAPRDSTSQPTLLFGRCRYSPPPSLLYRENTSRPSLRTNWTCLVPPPVPNGPASTSCRYSMCRLAGALSFPLASLHSRAAELDAACKGKARVFVVCRRGIFSRTAVSAARPSAPGGAGAPRRRTETAVCRELTSPGLRSQTATLLEMADAGSFEAGGALAERRVQDVQGGLAAWAACVDQRFPRY
jgi:rhodanese-related sulfurtransferase